MNYLEHSICISLPVSLISRHLKVRAYFPNAYIVKARAIFCAALTIACGLLPRLSIFAIYGPCYSPGAWKHTWEMKKRVKMAFFIIKCCFCRQLTLGFYLYSCLIYRLIPETSLEPLLKLGWQWLSTVFSLCPLEVCKLFNDYHKIVYFTKGQLNSKWIYEVIICPKIPTKNYRDFCPGSFPLKVSTKESLSSCKKNIDFLFVLTLK